MTIIAYLSAAFVFWMLGAMKSFGLIVADEKYDFLEFIIDILILNPFIALLWPLYLFYMFVKGVGYLVRGVFNLKERN